LTFKICLVFLSITNNTKCISIPNIFHSLICTKLKLKKNEIFIQLFRTKNQSELFEFRTIIDLQDIYLAYRINLLIVQKCVTITAMIFFFVVKYSQYYASLSRIHFISNLILLSTKNLILMKYRMYWFDKFENDSMLISKSSKNKRTSNYPERFCSMYAIVQKTASNEQNVCYARRPILATFAARRLWSLQKKRTLNYPERNCS